MYPARVPPALVVEVLSPSTRHYDQTKKKRAYQEFGVDEYWIVDLEMAQVEVYHFAGVPADTTVEPDVCRERLFWQPRPKLPPCDIVVPELWER